MHNVYRMYEAPWMESVQTAHTVNGIQQIALFSLKFRMHFKNKHVETF